MDILALSSSSAAPITEDERDEFLKRENEISDQLQEALKALKQKEMEFNSISEVLSHFKGQDRDLVTENKKLSANVNDLNLQLEKITFEHKESLITIDSLKDVNSELAGQIDELKVSNLKSTNFLTKFFYTSD
jgi:kinesin family member 5